MLPDWLLLAFGSLVGLPAFISFVIDMLKRFGVVKDGDAPNWVTGGNLIGLALVFVLSLFPAINLPGLDAQLATIVKILVMIVSLIPATAWSQLVSKITHMLNGGTFLGYSFTVKRIRG
jgi:hypothetical protein